MASLSPLLAGHKTVVLCAVVVNLILTLCFGYKAQASYQQIGADWPIQVAASLLIWGSVFCLGARLLVGSLYLFSTAYIVTLLVFHLGQVVPAALGIIEPAEVGLASRAGLRVERAAWLVLLALSCLGAGFFMGVWRGKVALQDRPGTEDPKKALEFAVWAGLWLMIASVFFLAHAILTYGNVLNYDRFELFFSSAGDSRGLGALTMTFPAAVALLVIGAKPGAKRYAALGLGLLSALLVLLAGDRGIALHSLLVVVVVWVKLGRRLPTAVALLTLLGVLISIPLVGHLRMMGTYSEIDQEKIEAAARDMNVVTGLVGLGATLHGLGIVLEQFPQQQDYRYGSTYVGALRAGIPNLSFQKSAPQVDLSGSTMSREVVQNLSPSSWLAYHVLGRQKMLQGHGTGFTAVGEPYMNFGVPGVALFFMVLGYWLGRLEVIDLTSNRLVLVFVLACLPNLIATTRNDFIAFTKPTSFVVIILVASYGITWVWRRGVTRMA